MNANRSLEKVFWLSLAKSDEHATNSGHMRKTPETPFAEPSISFPREEAVVGFVFEFQPEKYGTDATMSSMSTEQISAAFWCSGVMR